MSYKSKAHLYLIISLVIGICLSIVLLLDLRFSQAATPESLASLALSYAIELVPDQMILTGDVATRDNCTHPIVCSWLEDTPTGTIILGVDPTSPDPLTWDGGSATAEIPLTDFSPAVLVLKLSWPDRDGKGLHSPEQDGTGTITLDGRPLWGKRTIHLGTLNDYYAAEHEPILTTIVLTQSITHTLTFSVSARTAWDLSQIELSAYSYPTTTIKGIGYSPYRDCQYPGGDSQPSVQDIEEDLFRLFHTTNAIRTYSARGVNGQIPALANAIGLPVFAGAWLDTDLQNAPMVEEDDAEIEALIDLACTTDLEGVIVGSEYYLRSERTITDTIYLLDRIRQVRGGIRDRCAKDLPLTTAEVDDLIFEWESRDAVVARGVNPHFDEILEEIDFVMVHIYPFWYGLPIDGAAAFTVKRYKAIQDLIEQHYFGKRVIIGEAGWPSAGAPNYGEEPYDRADLPTDREPAVPSLENQHRYMIEFLWLAEKEGVEYMYFDAFDELWKIEERGRVGQHWGYSYYDRTAKHNFYGVLLPSEQLSSYHASRPYVELTDTSSQSLIQPSSSITFPVFTEWPMGPDDHFVPSGWMGITETIGLYECDRTNPHGGEMAIRVSFSPTGTDSWGGIYWQHPENNWGKVVTGGIDLDEATYLRFYARGAEGGEQVRFLMGGIWGLYPDSQQPALSTDVITLTQQWSEYTIDLRGRDLSRVIGGFAFATDRCLNTEPITFYLDDIEYVLKGDPGAPPPTPTPETPYTFDVYRDKDIAGNHYVPSGWMGDTGDIALDECWRGDPHTGSTAIRVEYTAEGEEPYECDGLSPCDWAGVYWQDPADNWGDRPGGYDLTGARALTFAAMGERGGEKISFKVGGIGCGSAAYPDSLCPVRVFDPAPTILTTTWTVYTVPLSADLNLSSLVGGFLWTASKADNPTGATFYLDDIQYLFNVEMPSSSPFSTPPIPIGVGSSRPFDLEFGDANRDGYLDLALGNHAPNQVCWNNGDRTFDCQNAFAGITTFDVDWGDMNKDGYLDLVVANSQVYSQSQPNLVCLNNGNHTFTCTSFSTCSGDGDLSCHTALGDVDDDGDLDIALGNQKAQDLIYFNDGNGVTFSTTATTCYDGATQDMAFGDVDNDDDLDLIVIGHSPDFVCINDGTGTFTETHWLAYRIDDGTWSVALGDADGDGDLDVAAAEEKDYPNEVYLNDGHGNFTEKLLFGPVWEKTGDVAWGDVDGDGDLDLALGNSYRPTMIYFNEPVAATPSFTLTNPIYLGGAAQYRTLSVAFGDVDGDCDLDLAVGNDGGQNVVYLNTLLGGCVRLPIILKDYP
jgi:exo-beta-1,3-glucanase (GH17 family)